MPFNPAPAEDMSEATARDLSRQRLESGPGKQRLQATRREVHREWRAVNAELVLQNQLELAQQVRKFVAALPPPQTEKEFIVAGLSATRERRVVRDGPNLTR
jgi:hypothetical protein